MAYTPTVWVNNSSPPLSAENLNKLTDEIKALASTYSISHFLPTWANDIAPALTDAAPLNEMERVVELLAIAVGLSYTKTTWEAGWTPARNASRFNKLEEAVATIAEGGQVSTSYYVSSSAGNDQTGDGTASRPWKTLLKACASVSSGTIRLAAGTYSETATCALPSGVSLVGAGESATIIRCASSSVNPLLLVQNTANQTVENLTLDGQDKTTAFFGMQAFSVANLTITHVTSKGWKCGENHAGGACQIKGATDLEVSYCTFLNSSYDTTGYGAGTFGIGGLQRADIHHNYVSSDVALALKGSQPGGIFHDVDIHDNTFLVYADRCGAGQWNNLCAELWSVSNVENCQWRNNFFNGVLSLTSDGSALPSGTRYRITHNHWDITNSNYYGIELDVASCEVSHNYFHGNGGQGYPIAHFVDQPRTDALVHHNVMDGFWAVPGWMARGGQTASQFYNNTVVVRTLPQSIFKFNELGFLQNTVDIRNNLFHSTVAVGDKMGVLDSATIDHNLYYNISARGTNTRSGNTLPLAGGWAAAYLPTGAAIDGGVHIPGITDGYVGTAPDLGAFDGGVTFAVGPQ